jgi:hypothetical protein
MKGATSQLRRMKGATSQLRRKLTAGILLGEIASTLGGPTLKCDSLSFGIRFQSSPAQLGKPYVDAEPPSQRPNGQNPAADRCGT